MLKQSSKKKRSRVELEEVKDEEDLLTQDKQAFLREYKRMKANHMEVSEPVAPTRLSEAPPLSQSRQPTMESKMPSFTR